MSEEGMVITGDWNGSWEGLTCVFAAVTSAATTLRNEQKLRNDRLWTGTQQSSPLSEAGKYSSLRTIGIESHQNIGQHQQRAARNAQISWIQIDHHQLP
jgi:hypothetical protein